MNFSKVQKINLQAIFIETIWTQEPFKNIFLLPFCEPITRSRLEYLFHVVMSFLETRHAKKTRQTGWDLFSTTLCYSNIFSTLELFLQEKITNILSTINLVYAHPKIKSCHICTIPPKHINIHIYIYI